MNKSENLIIKGNSDTTVKTGPEVHYWDRCLSWKEIAEARDKQEAGGICDCVFCQEEENECQLTP